MTLDMTMRPDIRAVLGQVEGDVVEGLVADGAADALPAEEDEGRADALGLLDRALPDGVLVGLVEARGEEADDRRRSGVLSCSASSPSDSDNDKRS